MKSTINGMFSRSKKSNVGDEINRLKPAEWELRPGGMLVQKRNSDENQNPVSGSTSSIKIRVKFGSTYQEIRISSQASFGELKKMLAEPTGLHPQDQKIFFKRKERDSKSYLDEVKVKDGSKMEVVEDIESRERRALETLKLSKKNKSSKALNEIILDIDKYAREVSALEASSSKGEIIAEMDVDNLIDSLMRILIKLDEVVAAEGDLKLQRKEQVGRVQKQIESLDKLKEPPNYSKLQKQPLKHSESFIVTTKWETFD
ncbi:BAG family molecular chaperone regulator 1 [Neltuma alba]|uniref:BAG family molecular chaperone regulator 1 n=1 Tax=Neltuma alba TaxID=207710 RepID=UPI0010A59048|nr:BAG family molecular chaperone regulator 1-like [Prosopis alba]